MKKEIEILDGYEARIEGNKVIIEPKKNEDEIIREYLIRLMKQQNQNVPMVQKAIAYLEKQKEQKPAEWSEEDEKRINSIFNDFKQDVVPDEEDQEWLNNRVKSLRPQPHWKPSEEQMKALKLAYEDAFECPESGVPHLPLESLLSDLQKLVS